MGLKTKSFLRREEYRLLSQLELSGKVLDVGGSKKSGYHELIKGKPIFVVGNIDKSYGIDVQFDAESDWPFSDGEFSAVMMVNVLEHLFNYQKALSESARVLKPGGVIVGVVPFMFNVHGSPSDYFRFTGFALERLLINTGFSQVEIIELGTGAFSVVYHNLIGFARWPWLAVIGISFCRMLDRTVSYLKRGNKMSAKYMPLGYYFKGTKSKC